MKIIYLKKLIAWASKTQLEDSIYIKSSLLSRILALRKEWLHNTIKVIKIKQKIFYIKLTRINLAVIHRYLINLEQRVDNHLKLSKYSHKREQSLEHLIWQVVIVDIVEGIKLSRITSMPSWKKQKRSAHLQPKTNLAQLQLIPYLQKSQTLTHLNKKSMSHFKTQTIKVQILSMENLKRT